MTVFLRLLANREKAEGLAASCAALRAGCANEKVFQVAPESFRAVPGAPFAYWVTAGVRSTFEKLPALDDRGRTARRGPSTSDDVRYVRLWWEVDVANPHGYGVWRAFCKGGVFSRYFADIHLLVDWEPRRSTFLGFFGRPGREIERPESVNYFFRPGLTWPLRTQSGLNLRVMPSGCIFGHKGPAAFVVNDSPAALLALCAIVNSQAFRLLVSLQMTFGAYEVGVIQKTPVPDFSSDQRTGLADLARRAWSLKRAADTVEETSHAFVLPAALRSRLGNYDPSAIEVELARIQAEIDAIAFDLYGFSEAEIDAGEAAIGAAAVDDETEDSDPDDDSDEEGAAEPVDRTASLLSWAIGVAFGRFDLYLATGEHAAPLEPDPFDPLPAKSPGMLPDGGPPFHAHAGILVDDPGHPHDLSRLVEDVLAQVDCPAPDDARRWLQRDFFPFHLQRYSKSRRKAPIYWPLSMASGGYTLWIYYPGLTSQTLYTAINDFLEPKLKDLPDQIAALRAKGDRTREAVRGLERLQELEQELIELRDALLRIAPKYQPNHDDGVQITAAPLWPLFRHKPWQKVLKESWEKLEKGDYDWAHLAMTYWPDRVRAKCRTDKSLAIAHGLEDLYEPPPKVEKKKPRTARRRRESTPETP